MYLITVLMVFRSELKWLRWPYLDSAMCRLLLWMCSCPASCSWCRCANRASASHLHGAVTFKQPCCMCCGPQRDWYLLLMKCRPQNHVLEQMLEAVFFLEVCFVSCLTSRNWSKSSVFPLPTLPWFCCRTQKVFLLSYMTYYSWLYLGSSVSSSPSCIFSFMHVTFVTAPGDLQATFAQSCQFWELPWGTGLAIASVVDLKTDFN